MNQDIDARIFKEFLQYDLTSGSLWEIVEIFERHRTNFKQEISQYQQEITQAKQELRSLRESINQTKTAQENQDSIKLKPKKSPKPQIKNKTTSEDIPKDYKQRIVELELENRRLEIELRDLKQEIELNARESLSHKSDKKPKKDCD
ncbi:hypothetical protein [Helicobacter equorum]|uniref:hypothetical protein n=1 Tax=Helicobacter equorum TaxID=361872 RepID=UPI000CF02742|nr:hypothetical protein [Helicobacter equorum]